MVERAFHRRPGRIIALGRFVLAALLVLVLWFDPDQISQQPEAIYGIFVGYAVWSGLVLVLTWRSWWLDHRLADPSHFVDIAACAILVFFTESYTSPFYTFFVFLILSASLRWNWRESALTAAAALLFFLTAGVIALATGEANYDLKQLLLRFSYLIAVSLIFIWFMVNEEPPAPLTEAEVPGEGPPIQPALRRVAAQLAPRRIVFAWGHKEEPWVNIAGHGADAPAGARLGPDDYDGLAADPAGGRPYLFDVVRGRVLYCEPGDRRRLRAGRAAFDGDFAARFGLRKGLAVPLRAQDYEGEMFVTGIDGLCAEDLRVAETLAQEMTAMFDRSSRAAVSEEAAVKRARMALARDLHDGVVQVLAGTAFRLEAMKEAIDAGEDVKAEIDAVKGELKEEQHNIRTFIAGLRDARSWNRLTDLASGLPIVAEQLARRWSLDCDLAGADMPVEGPLRIEHELHQIIHEAAANAVRHGGATAIRIALRRDGGDIVLDIADNGAGLAAAGRVGADGAEAGADQPWSVRERVTGLGGTLSITTEGRGTQLSIRIPAEGGR